jgi:hypothetical protein
MARSFLFLLSRLPRSSADRLLVELTGLESKWSRDNFWATRAVLLSAFLVLGFLWSSKLLTAISLLFAYVSVLAIRKITLRVISWKYEKQIAALYRKFS